MWGVLCSNCLVLRGWRRVAARGAGTVGSRPGDGDAFLLKAQEFLEAVEDAVGRGNHTAAVGNAVHAVISAADAVVSVRLGERWRGEHFGAVDHVAGAGEEGRICADSLRRVLPLKTEAEYDPAPLSSSKVTRAVRAARSAVVAAERVVAQSHR